MKKQISKFRIEPHGFFIDLADGNGRIGVDRETGHILLDEGEGGDRYHGAVIEPVEFEGIALRMSADGNEATVMLSFGQGCSHVLGTTNDPAAGRLWTEEVSKLVRAQAAATRDEFILPRARRAISLPD